MLFYLKGVLNLRGGDIDYNPVFLSHLLFDFSDSELIKGTLYINPIQIDAEVSNYLKENNIEVKKYDDILLDIKNSESIFIDKNYSNYFIYNQILNSDSITMGVSPINLIKVLKKTQYILIVLYVKGFENWKRIKRI